MLASVCHGEKKSDISQLSTTLPAYINSTYLLTKLPLIGLIWQKIIYWCPVKKQKPAPLYVLKGLRPDVESKLKEN